ncbi:MAG TPA: tetratricopeptide repeat protein [Candidatus Nitrosotalea sp.]|nr:tetratricopeptide repeat protein [Nitrososphaerota archaeon]HKU32746.1 tetratricopeptide repeat protein [Candidatus Nitrosotalea sp.]
MVFSWFKKNKPELPPTIEYKKVSSKKEASEDLVKIGEDAANKSNYEQALKYFEKAIEMNPKNDFAWGDRGLMLDKLGRKDEAIESFSRALVIDSSNAITWHNKGLTLIRSNKIEESIECFDKAIELNEKYAKAWYNKGRALALLGNEREGQKSFDTARKLDPMLYTKLKKMKS